MTALIFAAALALALIAWAVWELGRDHDEG